MKYTRFLDLAGRVYPQALHQFQNELGGSIDKNKEITILSTGARLSGKVILQDGTKRTFTYRT